MRKAQPKIIFRKNGQVSVVFRGRVVFKSRDLHGAKMFLTGWYSHFAKKEA